MAPQLTPEMIKLWSVGDPTRLLHLARQIESHEGWKAYLSPTEHSIYANAIELGGEHWTNLISTSTTRQNAELDSIAELDDPPSIDNPVEHTPTPAPAAATEISMHTPIPSPKREEDDETPFVAGQSNGSNGTIVDQSPEKEKLQIDFVALALKIRYMLYEKSIDYLFAAPTTANSMSFEVDFFFLEDEENEKMASDKDEPDNGAPATRQLDEDDYDDEDEDEDEDENKDEEEDKEKIDESTQSLKPSTPSSNSLLKDASTTKKSSEPDPKPVTDGIITPADTPSSSETKQVDEVVQMELHNMYQTLDSNKENLYLRHPKREAEDSGPNAVGKVPGKLSHMDFGAANLSLKHLLSVIDDERHKLSVTDNELKNLITEVRKNRSKWASEDRVGQEELYEAAEKVVLELRAYTEHSTAFLNRVNKRDAPNYFNVIKNPMDLSTVMKKLKALQYRSKKEFVDDLMLIWDNCFLYNADPQHYLRKHAAAMEKKTRQLIPLVPEIVIKSKSDLEAEEVNVTIRDMSVDVDMESEDGGDLSVGHRSSSRAAIGGKGVGAKKTPSTVDHDEDYRNRDSQGLEKRVIPLEEEGLESVDYEVIPTVPETLWNISTQLKASEDEQFETAVDISKEVSPFIPLKIGAAGKMDKNLEQIQQIRKICSKISVVKRMQQQPHLYSTQLRPYAPEKLEEKDVDFESRLPGHSDVPKSVIEACMQRSVAKMAMHTGYDECHMLAMEGLSMVAADYMQRLGRTLCLYMESNRGVRRFSLEDVILQTLHENGTYDLGSLESYMRDDIDRFGTKLKDVRERMGTVLTDILRPALVGENDDTQFNDGSQEFVAGGFSDDIGEDFFGFKELGLDEELGLSSFSVPLHLLHSRLHANAQVQAAPVAQSKIMAAPAFKLFTRDKIEQQIGLLRPFFASRFEKFERDGVLIEDEALPPKQRNQRPKLPPTGKIAVIKKRSSDNTFGSDSAKKKKKL
ncbi:hypothetical protein V1512DRAFT_263594 [Lipomyces arxii]|uniref:uncharacterized protein n=1 Tax=Lipomyces arxii TaxID=56418 RepID=UPI0034CF4EA7